MNISIVWFKKDLRIVDHKPLYEACKSGLILPLYIYESEIIEADDYDPRHHQFINDSLLSLKESLKAIGGFLHLEHGSAIDVFKKLKNTLPNSVSVYSHEETGNWVSYQRDIKFKKWCNNQDINWYEYQQHGVQRPIFDRDGWSYEWNKFMNLPILDVSKNIKFFSFDHQFDLIDIKKIGKHITHTSIQKGGREAGLKLLDSFLETRGKNYSKEMSSPLTAITSCSRLSPYLTFGNLSVREVYKIAKAKRDKLKGIKNLGNWRSSISSFLGRLRWHCHFIQKLEDQPQIEWENMSRSYDSIRDDFNEAYFIDWKNGQTGYPLIDACMRCLKATGYINFRMRAMLVSFASYDLWLDWRKTSKYLATQFTDYEPGIHYSQFQMQSGVTGINSIRIYNPVKQQKDHDGEGIFVRKWVPELKEVPLEYIFTPHLMSEGFQDIYNCKIGTDYPEPIVDHGLQVKKAKQILYGIKKTEGARVEAKKVYLKHGSRRRPLSKRVPMT